VRNNARFEKFEEETEGETTAQKGGVRHVMLSYPWEYQALAVKVYEALAALHLKVWMDIKGGIEGGLGSDMAKGVEDSFVFAPFMCTKYENKPNCIKELNYAVARKKTIMPVKVDESHEYSAQGPLGLATADMLYADLSSPAKFDQELDRFCTRVLKIFTTQRASVQVMSEKKGFFGGNKWDKMFLASDGASLALYANVDDKQWQTSIEFARIESTQIDPKKSSRFRVIVEGYTYHIQSDAAQSWVDFINGKTNVILERVNSKPLEAATANAAAPAATTPATTAST